MARTYHKKVNRHISLLKNGTKWRPGTITALNADGSMNVRVGRHGETYTNVIRVGATAPVGGIGYVSLPGVAGSYVSTPDHAALDVTGDIDIRACLALDNWDNDSFQTIVGKWAVGGQRSYLFAINASGQIQINWSDSGATQGLACASLNTIPVANSVPVWVRVTFDVSTTAGTAREFTFYTSTQSIDTPAASVVWTQLELPTSQALAANIFSGSSIVEIGTFDTGANALTVGKIYYIEIRNGINGTIVANPDFRPANNGTSITDSTGKVWTKQGTAQLINPATANSVVRWQAK